MEFSDTVRDLSDQTNSHSYFNHCYALSKALSAENPQPPARRNIELELLPFKNPQPRHRRIDTYASIVLPRARKENTYKRC